MFEKVFHKFVIDDFSITNLETSENLVYDDSLSAVAIRKLYSDNVYPLYVLTLKLTEEQREYIVKNKIVLNLSISRFSVDMNADTNLVQTTSEPTIDKTLVRETIIPFDKPIITNTPVVDEESNESSTENIKNLKTEYTLYCVPYNELRYNESVVNGIYKEANVNEIIINLISGVYSGDLYYQESNNVDRHESFIIPPMNLIPAIQYIDEKYMVYKYALNMFIDSNKMYIYDLTEKTRFFENELMIQVYKSVETADKSIYHQAQVDENESVRIYLEDNPMIITTKDLYSYIVGSKAVFNSYDDNFNVTSRNRDFIGVINKSRYFWNENKYKSFEDKKLKAITQFTQISPRNIDFTLIQPSTKITITGSDIENINGQYALTETNIFISTGDFKNYTGAVIYNIGKI